MAKARKPSIQTSRYKGAILAAGHGTRLRPLTSHCPKPLLPFAGIPLLFYAAHQLIRVGIDEILVNVHYLAEQLIEALNACPLPARFAISHEKTALLGTGGAFAAMAPLRGAADLLVVNGDIISDFPLGDLIAYHESLAALATMALLPEPHPGESKVWAHDGRVLAFGGETPPVAGATPHGFACIQVLTQGFLAPIVEWAPASVIDFYRAALARGETIGAFIRPAFWFDLGSPQSYFTAHMELLARWQATPFSSKNDPLGLIALAQELRCPLRFYPGGRPPVPVGRATVDGPSLIAPDGAYPRGCRLGPYAVVSEGVVWEGAVEVKEAVVFAGARLREEASPYEQVIIHPGASIACRRKLSSQDDS